jgi:aspartate ammonia-lyase
MDGKWNDQFVVDPFQAGAGTSHNMNANEVIANRATQILGGEIGKYYVHPNDHVNMAQSTNDVIPTSIRLGALWRLDELLTSLKVCNPRSKPSQKNSMMSSNRGAPICRMPCPCAWVRNLARTPKPSNATSNASADHRGT